MNEVIKVSAIGIICALACVIVRSCGAEFLFPTRIAAIVAIFTLAMLLISPVLELLTTSLAEHISAEYIEIILKALCIAYITEISGGLCRDCGETNIALGIETVGKIELIALSVPLLQRVLSLSEELLKW